MSKKSTRQKRLERTEKHLTQLGLSKCPKDQAWLDKELCNENCKECT